MSPEDAALQKSARAEAEKVQTALVKGDYGKVADLTHPKVIEALGGRDKMLAVMKRGIEEMKADGIEFKSVQVLDPSVPVKAGCAVWIHVPFDLVMTAPGKRIMTRSGLVGVTGDGGKTWKFLDTSQGRDALKAFVPDLPDALEIPRKQKPKVEDE